MREGKWIIHNGQWLEVGGTSEEVLVLLPPSIANYLRTGEGSPFGPGAVAVQPSPRPADHPR